jgi:hypothetical protein
MDYDREKFREAVRLVEQTRYMIELRFRNIAVNHDCSLVIEDGAGALKKGKRRGPEASPNRLHIDLMNNDVTFQCPSEKKEPLESILRLMGCHFEQSLDPRFPDGIVFDLEDADQYIDKALGALSRYKKPQRPPAGSAPVR